MERFSLEGDSLPGVYEIDANGALIYSSVKSSDGLTKRTYDGSIDFFREITLFSNASEFQYRFEVFKEANIPTDSFDFTCTYSTRNLTIRVLLARLLDGPTSFSFLVYIRHCNGSFKV